MKSTTKIFLLYLLSFSLNGFSQNEFSKWYFGQQAGLDFSTSPPTVLTNGMSTGFEGVATICDASGNLLFYTDGITVFNSAHAVMANGNGLIGHASSTQAGLIVKQPGSSSIYYIFTTNPSVSSGLCYSVVDIGLAAGMGSVTTKNTLVYGRTCEKQVAVRHCNGRDVWVISHYFGNDEFRAYLLTNGGLSSTPVVSTIGGSISVTGNQQVGHLKISPDGRKLAMASGAASSPTTSGGEGFQLFDFDAASGSVSNPLTLLSATNIPTGIIAYGVEFSPDGRKLYGTAIVNTTTSPTGIHQWDICGTNTANIIASQYSINTGSLTVSSIQRAIDGKLYIALAGSQSLSVINNPNASGAAMNFVANAISVAPKTCRLGLPNFINPYTHPVPAPFTNSLACQTSTFSVPPVPTFSSGCSSTPYAPNAYLWDFGEASSGASNTSTLVNPAHTYSSTGTYSVTLILYGNCTNDTLRQTVTLSTAGPTVDVSGNFSICKGDKYTYTASGATSYLWSNNSTATTIVLNPVNTTTYSVSGTLNGCMLSKSFTVEVNPCTGISSQLTDKNFAVFPNPFKNVISVEAQNTAELLITDVNGNILVTGKVDKGGNDINSSSLAPGIYLVHIKNSDTSWRGRFIKLE